MIRVTIKLDDETIARIEKVVEHFKDLDPEKVRAIMTAVEEGKEQYWQDMRTRLHESLQADLINASIAYHRPVSLRRSAYGISHPYKIGTWD